MGGGDSKHAANSASWDADNQAIVGFKNIHAVPLWEHASELQDGVWDQKRLVGSGLVSAKVLASQMTDGLQGVKNQTYWDSWTRKGHVTTNGFGRWNDGVNKKSASYFTTRTKFTPNEIELVDDASAKIWVDNSILTLHDRLRAIDAYNYQHLDEGLPGLEGVVDWGASEEGWFGDRAVPITQDTMRYPTGMEMLGGYSIADARRDQIGKMGSGSTAAGEFAHYKRIESGLWREGDHGEATGVVANILAVTDFIPLVGTWGRGIQGLVDVSEGNDEGAELALKDEEVDGVFDTVGELAGPVLGEAGRAARLVPLVGDALRVGDRMAGAVAEVIGNASTRVAGALDVVVPRAVAEAEMVADVAIPGAMLTTAVAEESVPRLPIGQHIVREPRLPIGQRIVRDTVIGGVGLGAISLITGHSIFETDSTEPDQVHTSPVPVHYANMAIAYGGSDLDQTHTELAPEKIELPDKQDYKSSSHAVPTETEEEYRTRQAGSMVLRGRARPSDTSNVYLLGALTLGGAFLVSRA